MEEKSLRIIKTILQKLTYCEGETIWLREMHVLPHVYKLQEEPEQGSLWRNPSHKLPSVIEVLWHWQLHGAAPTSY